jgi:hypothetical protein
MKNNFILVLLTAVLLATAGCTGGGQPSIPSATAAVSTTHTLPPAVSTTLPPAPPVTETARAVQTGFVVTAIPTTAATAAPAAGSTTTYTNRDFGFSLDIPRTWTTEGEWVTTAGSGKKYKIWFDEPTKSALQYVTITGGASGLRLDDYFNVNMKQFRADPDSTVTGTETLTLGGTRAEKIVMTTGTGENALGSIVILAIKGDNAYFFEFTSRLNRFDTYQQETAPIIDTLKFL